MRPFSISCGVLLAACGASPKAASTTTSTPIGEHTAAPSLDAAAIAGLPMAVVGLQSLPLDMGARTDRLLGAASYNVPCTDAIAKKLTGYYWPVFDDTVDISLPQLATGTMTVDEVVACFQAMEGGKRMPSSDPSLVALDSDHALLALPGGAILVARTAEQLSPLVVAKSKHPLAALLDPAPSSAEWTALAIDYTWELLGVESLGVILEYDQASKSGPLAIRVRFHDADAAQLARERFDHPDDVVARSVLGEGIAGAVEVIRKRGTLAVEGRDVVVRGRIQESEWSPSDSPLALFRALAVPLGRPLTAEENQRLLRQRR